MDLLRLLNPQEFEGSSYRFVRKGSWGRWSTTFSISESTTYNGLNVVKVYFAARSKSRYGQRMVTAAFCNSFSGIFRRESSLPEIINFSASSVPILQLGILGEGSERAVIERLQFELHPPTANHSAGFCSSSSLWRKQRQTCVNMDLKTHAVERPRAERSFGGIDLQRVMVLPSSTAKIGQSEYDILNNVAPRTYQGTGTTSPSKQVDGAMSIYMRDVAHRARRLSGADQHRFARMGIAAY